MDTYGIPTTVKSPHDSRTVGHPMRTKSMPVLCACLITILLLTLPGCATMRYGSVMTMDRLDSLKPKVSDRADVLLVLGEPRGRGAMQYASDIPPRTIWFYEYVEADAKSVSTKILLVFFDRDVYDGYLWFADESKLKIRMH